MKPSCFGEREQYAPDKFSCLVCLSDILCWAKAKNLEWLSTHEVITRLILSNSLSRRGIINFLINKHFASSFKAAEARLQKVIKYFKSHSLSVRADDSTVTARFNSPSVMQWVHSLISILVTPRFSTFDAPAELGLPKSTNDKDTCKVFGSDEDIIYPALLNRYHKVFVVFNPFRETHKYKVGAWVATGLPVIGWQCPWTLAYIFEVRLKIYESHRE